MSPAQRFSSSTLHHFEFRRHSFMSNPCVASDCCSRNWRRRKVAKVLYGAVVVFAVFRCVANTKRRQISYDLLFCGSGNQGHHLSHSKSVHDSAENKTNYPTTNKHDALHHTDLLCYPSFSLLHVYRQRHFRFKNRGVTAESLTRVLWYDQPKSYSSPARIDGQKAKDCRI